MADQPVMQRPDHGQEVPPGVRLPGGRWSPGTLVSTPEGVRCRVLPCFTGHAGQYGGDAVFVQPLGRREKPWQLRSSSELTVIPDGAC